MRKAGLIFIGLLLLFKIDCFAQLGNETITITTYYPSPHGVYGILNLYPNPDQPDNPMQGDLYFDKNNEIVKYYKNTAEGWVNLTGGGAGGGYWNMQADDSIINANPGKVIIDGNGAPVPNGEIFEIRGDTRISSNPNPALGESTILYLERNGNGTGSAIVFTDSASWNGYFLATRSLNPTLLEIGRVNPPPASNTEYFLTVADDKVGIGTTDPQQRLDVDGQIHASGDICTDAGGGACLGGGGGGGGASNCVTVTCTHPHDDDGFETSCVATCSSGYYVTGGGSVSFDPNPSKTTYEYDYPSGSNSWVCKGNEGGTCYARCCP